MADNEMEVAAAAPMTINHVIGQHQAVEQLKVALAAHWNDRAAGKATSFGSVLMSGPPGTGKTLLAKVLAAELGGTFREVMGQTLWTEDLNGILLEATDDSIIFIDEAALIGEDSQAQIYRALEDRLLFLPRNPYSSDEKCRTIPLARFTLILATTDSHGILAPLRDRMKLELQFQYYSLDELSELIRQRAHALRWEVETEVFQLVAKISKSTPRLALRHLECCYRCARAENAETITVGHFHQAVELNSLDKELGLDRSERAYLKAIAAHDRKAVRLHLLASRLGQPPQTLANVTESFLLREGLVTRTEKGRELTEKGWEYVRRNQLV